MTEKYDGDYFLRGRETGKSLYHNYRWLPDLTIPMAERIIDHCGIVKGARILDFGCARGYLVKALRGLGYEAYGFDSSNWAIENCDPEVKNYVNWTNDLWFTQKFDWVITKDVLEHVEYVSYSVAALREVTTKGIFCVVPLSKFLNGKYVIPDYEEDVTHIQRMPLENWTNFFLHPDWRVESAYRVHGVKDNYWKPEWKMGNGFITARRLEQ